MWKPSPWRKFPSKRGSALYAPSPVAFRRSTAALAQSAYKGFAPQNLALAGFISVKGWWIGVGGHFEKDETPEECLLREVKEETGLTLTSWRFRGLVTFLSDAWETEYMCLYTADGFEGDMITCDEGTLEWVKKSELERLNLWEGDKIFFKLLKEEHPFFSLKLKYRGDVLTEAVLDGKRLKTENQG